MKLKTVALLTAAMLSTGASAADTIGAYVKQTPASYRTLEMNDVAALIDGEPMEHTRTAKVWLGTDGTVLTTFEYYTPEDQSARCPRESYVIDVNGQAVRFKCYKYTNVDNGYFLGPSTDRGNEYVQSTFKRAKAVVLDFGTEKWTFSASGYSNVVKVIKASNPL